MAHGRPRSSERSWRQLTPRHQRAGASAEPAFPLAVLAPLGSEILPPQFGLLFADIENRPADPTCLSAHQNLRSFTGMPSAPALDWLRAKP